MAKTSYKIPTSLDRSMLDHEVGISGGGWSLKPTPMKVILFWAVSILVLFWVCTNTFVSSANWYWIALVVIFWVAATAFFGKYNKTKELQLNKVPALLAYLPRSAREVVTRRDANPSAMYSIARIDAIDDSGLILMADGTVSQVYLVVGSGSILVFEEDKKAILDRVDAFYRKVEPDVELAFITTKEPQRIYKQLAHLEDINVNMKNRHPELLELMQERYTILTDFVGDSFTSIHQYLVIKADNMEALRRAHTLVQSEVEDSNLMLKQATMLNREDAMEVLRVFYRGVGS